ncbi:MAG: hypothetical protein MR594_09100 [Lachnospiraceae bacterium]|nr:hypothetical protein [Lachnospiraceae bacterium]
MKKQLWKAIVCLGLITVVGTGNRTIAEAHTTGELKTENGVQYLYADGQKVINDFVFDGTYTYYAQADGTPMTNCLTYHPDGEHIIYFDENGHEVFNDFQYCSSVGYTCYFDSQGYIYKDKITFANDKVYYLNANGKMEDAGWFQFANGMDYGFANADGTLKNGGFTYDPWGRVVFYNWNGVVARGIISDGAYFYNMDFYDGHFLEGFPIGDQSPI